MSDTLAFDFKLVCWFTGQAAIKAGNADNQGPIEDDYYVRDTTLTFHEQVSSPADPSTCVGDANQPFTCTAGDILKLYATGSTTATVDGKDITAFSTVWLHVSGDKPDYLFMQFTP